MPALSFSLSNKVFNELIKASNETGISRSSLANQALEEYLVKMTFVQKLDLSLKQFEEGKVVRKTLTELEAMENE